MPLATRGTESPLNLQRAWAPKQRPSKTLLYRKATSRFAALAPAQGRFYLLGGSCPPPLLALSYALINLVLLVLLVPLVLIAPN